MTTNLLTTPPTWFDGGEKFNFVYNFPLKEDVITNPPTPPPAWYDHDYSFNCFFFMVSLK